MKKISILLAGLMLGGAAYAQTVENPNRLLLKNSADITSAYVLDRVSEVSFARVEGEVKADIQISNVTANSLTLSVTRTEACQGFRIAVVPYTTAAQLKNPDAAIRYINDYCRPATYYEDFSNGTLSGVELNPGGDYSVMTIGIDELGCEVGVCRADFNVPAAPVVGDPKVAFEVVDTQLESFKIKLTPNADVSAYYCVAGEKGELAEQYIQFGPMMGFTSITDMIMSWGQPRRKAEEIEWKDMAPNTEYEIYVVCLDVNGNPAPYVIFECSTESMGGPGEAKVTITPGKYVLANWNDEMLPSQFFTYTPNDQSSCYRFGVYEKSQYEAHRDEIRQQLCSEPPMPSMLYWFFYTEMTTDYQINPNTTVVVIAAAKNINGEWGPINELEYTTPAQVDGSGVPGLRPVPQRMRFTPGRIPSLGTGQIKLTKIGA